MKINKFQMSNLTFISSIDIPLDTSVIFSISNSIDAYISTPQFYGISDSQTIPFIFSASKNQIPYIKHEEYSLAIREKVDLSSAGTQERTIADENKDLGQNGSLSYPYKPRGLNANFIELKGDKS